MKKILLSLLPAIIIVTFTQFVDQFSFEERVIICVLSFVITLIVCIIVVQYGKKRIEEEKKRIDACIDEAKLHLLAPKKPRSTNIHFHNLVAESTHNRMIYLEITAITRIMIRHVDYSSLDNYSISKTIERHERIFKAIESGDSELASREMYNDIEMIHLALKNAQVENS